MVSTLQECQPTISHDCADQPLTHYVNIYVGYATCVKLFKINYLLLPLELCIVIESDDRNKLN